MDILRHDDLPKLDPRMFEQLPLEDPRPRDDPELDRKVLGKFKRSTAVWGL